MDIFKIDHIIRDSVNGIIEEEWAGPLMVTRGKIIDTSDNPGFVCVVDREVKGFVTFVLSRHECEITTLMSMEEDKGIGSRLIHSVIQTARAAGCGRVRLITTNDNTRAIRFYQKRGFSLKAVHLNAIEKARELKPSIPLSGIDGIPILHEFEFEMMV